MNLYRHLKQHTEETEHAGDTKADTNGEQLVEYESDADETVSSAVPSNTQELKTTKLVPINERYKCNAKGCHYLSLDSDMFQSHLRTLHSKEVDFACPHCQSVICQGKMNVGLILAHLTLHGEKLFKCSFCSYYDSSAYAMKTHCKLHVAEEDVEIVTVEVGFNVFIIIIKFENFIENRI